MQIIEKLSQMIEEEIEDADKYMTCAMNLKETDRELADTFFTISGEEIGHMDKLHAQVVRLINAYKKEKGEPPEAMQAIYDYLHRKHIDHATGISIKRALYRG